MEVSLARRLICSMNNGTNEAWFSVRCPLLHPFSFLSISTVCTAVLPYGFASSLLYLEVVVLRHLKPVPLKEAVLSDAGHSFLPLLVHVVTQQCNETCWGIDLA